MHQDLKKILFDYACHAACRILVPDQGPKLHPLQWKQGILTIGPPGKFCIRTFKSSSLDSII